MAIGIVGFYAGICGILLLILSYRVVQLRGKLKVDIGDGGKEPLILAIRAQANFTEYAPLTLVLLFVLAFAGSHPLVLHILGAALVIGRVLHAQGLSGNRGYSLGRYWGIVTTWLTLAAASLLCLLLLFGIRL